MLQGNPRFAPTSFKGRYQVNGIPVHKKEFNVTNTGYIGSLEGTGLSLAPFGHVVSMKIGEPHTLYLGMPTGDYIPVGILYMEESKMQQDPAQNWGFFESEAATYMTFGLIQYMKWEIDTAGLKAPSLNGKVIFQDATGSIGFVDFNDAVPVGWTQLNAFVQFVEESNSCTVFIGRSASLVVDTGIDVTDVTAEPTATPAAGAVPRGTPVTLASATLGAKIYYTLDGTTPTVDTGILYTGQIAITAPVTIIAIATAPDAEVSSILSASYTLS